MSFFVVVRKPIKSGFIPANTKNPTKNEIFRDLNRSQCVILMASLEDASKVAELFFHQPRPPKVGGYYGLIVEVNADELSDIKIVNVDIAEMYNAWVDTQEVNYSKIDNTGTECLCSKVAPHHITSIRGTHVLENVKRFNPNLHDVDFTPKLTRCLVM